MTTIKKKPVVKTSLFFDGRCEEALEFYRQALGAEVDFLMRFKNCPAPDACPAGAGEKIMHATFHIGDTTVIASDGHCLGKPVFQGFALAVMVDDVAEADRMFAALADGGKVFMAQAKTFFSPSFGMVTDRFGVLWKIYVAA